MDTCRWWRCPDKTASGIKTFRLSLRAGSRTSKAFRSPRCVDRVTFLACPRKVTQRRAPRRPLVSCATRLSRGSAYSASCAGCRRAASLRRPFGLFPRQAALLGAANGDQEKPISTSNTKNERLFTPSPHSGGAGGVVGFIPLCRTEQRRVSRNRPKGRRREAARRPTAQGRAAGRPLENRVAQGTRTAGATSGGPSLW